MNTVAQFELIGEPLSRLISVRDVVEHELAALGSLHDERLEAVLRAMSSLHAELATALDVLERPVPGGTR